MFNQITENELPSPSTWLDVVWTLAVLGVVAEIQHSSVLNPIFVDRISTSAGMK